jgi:hypothetical protein
VARSRSSTSSSDGFLLDLVVALLVLLAFEWMVRAPMTRLELHNAALNAPPAAEPAELADFHQVSSARDPIAFLAGLRDQLEPATIVFVGDSQGMGVKDTTGLPYPKLVARALARRPGGGSVISLHLGGATTFEQGSLLLGLLRAGVVPDVVFWAHSIFSLRKNEIRAELVPLFESLPPEETGRPAVILIGGAPEPPAARLPLSQRVLGALTQRVDDALSASTALRFSRRELWQKVTILWDSPLARLVPARLRPKSASHPDPSAANLEASARFAGRVTGVLRRRGVRVVAFLSPIDLAATPRPFSPRAEADAYPKLERAIRDQGGEFVSWLELLPPAQYGRYDDGSPDAFHIRAAGHDTLASRLLEVLDAKPRGR